MTSERSATSQVRPNPELVGEAARYLENGAGGADYIAYVLSKEILRLAKIASRAT